MRQTVFENEMLPSTGDAHSNTAGPSVRQLMFVAALLVVFGLALQGLLPQKASALIGTPCLQTGLETVATDEPSYPAGSTVHVTGTGYSLDCDVVAQITRPDSAIDAETVTTDVSGSFAYDYVIPGPPYATGTYLVDVLGDGAVLAHTSFEDAAQVNQLFANGPPATGLPTFVFTVGDTIYSNARIDNGMNGRIVITDGSGVARFTSACLPESSFEFDATVNPNGPPRYTFQASDPVSTDNAHQWTYTVRQFASADTTCAGATQGAASQNFSFAKASLYQDPVLAITKTNFAAGQTAYVRVDGFEPSSTRVNATWLLPSAATACSNTGGNDRPDSSAGGVLPNPAASSAPAPSTDGFHYPSRIQNVGADDPWNYNENYDGYNAVSNPTPCPGFTGANQGTWKLRVQGNGTHVTTLSVFVVDTTPPTVTINQAAGQLDPTTGSPIHFTAVFSEAVTGFAGSDVSFAGSTSGGTKNATVTEVAPINGTTFDVSVTGMSSRGTVVASIPAAAVSDAAGNTSDASTSTDNSVTWDRVPAATAPSFSPASPKTNDSLTASTTTSDPDGDNISVSWTWKVNRGGNVCTVQTSSSASAPAGPRTATLDLSQNYAPTSCTGAMINPLNPSKGDVVRVEATPNDGLFDGTLQSSNITIVNTTPTVTLGGGNTLSPNEGSAYTYNYSISDADGDTIASVATSCGTGSKTNASNTNTSGSFDCTFADGPASTSVSAQATDTGFQAGAGNNATQSISVQNIAPSIAVSGDASVNEGSPYSLSLGAVTDPGTDTVSSYVVHWGDGNTDSYSTNGAKSHAYADGPASPSITVDLVDEDGTFLDRANPFSVTVNNIAPTVTYTIAPPSANEGQSKTYNFSVNDPGNDTYAVGTGKPDCGSSGSLVSGSYSISGNSGTKTGSFTCSYPDDIPTGTASDSTHVTISFTDDDGDTGNTADQLVTVNNVDPTVVISGPSGVSESQSLRTYSFDTTDPGTDTFSHGAPSCGASGVVVGLVSFNSATGDGSFDCRFADDDPTGTSSDASSVSITVSDDDTGSDSDSLDVTVSNVDPMLILSGTTTANEGDTKHYSYSWTDPGTDTYPSHSVDCGLHGTMSNEAFDGTAKTGSFDCTWSDDSGSGTADVSASVTDDDGGSGSDTKHVTVANVAPTATFNDNGPVNEGSDITLSLTDAHDVSSVDEAASFEYRFSCDDGTTWSAWSSTSTASCSTDDNGVRHVKGEIRDKDLGVRTYSADVTVNNVAPTATVSGPTPVTEGSQHTYTFTVNDPGTADTFTVDASYPKCGTGGTYVTGTLQVTAHGGTFDCYFPDGPATTNVSIKVTDDDGGSDADSEAVQVVDVTNVAPTATLGNNGPADEGSPATVTFTSQYDPSPDDTAAGFRYEYHCDGSVFAAAPDYSTADTTASHQCTFDDNGTHKVRARIIDQNNGWTGYTTDVTVDNVAPTATFTNNGPVSEGTAINLSLTDPHDVSSADEAAGFMYAFDCGDGLGYGAFSVSSSQNCPTSDNGLRNVGGKIKDKDGGVREYTGSVSVGNANPSVTLSGPTSANEGDTKHYSYTWTDAGSADTFPSHSVDCGIHGSSSNEAYDAGAKTGSFDCTWSDDSGGGTADVSASVTDDDGGTGSDTEHVAVANVPPGTPTLVSPTDGSTTGNGTPTFDWSDVTDQGDDTVTYTIQIDNSGCSFPSPDAQTSGLTMSQYTTPLADGTYCWRIRATDSDGANGSYSATRTVTIDTARPSVTINQASGQDDPTGSSPIHFTAEFSEAVTGFTGSDVTISGTAGGSKTVTVADSGDHATYDVAVSGMTDGTVIASVGANGAQDAGGNQNTVSTSSDNSVTYDATRPTVTVNQAVGQPDPTSVSPIHFTAVFSEPVSGFQNGDVVIGGTAGGGMNASVTNPSADNRTFDIAISGMTTSGTVTASIDANKAQDAAGNANYASTSTDNTVTWNQQTANTAPVVTITSPTFGQLYAKGSANVNLSASWTDPDAGQTHTCSINWDDGAVTTPAVNEAARTCGQAHTYPNAGVYTINVTICDNASGCGSAQVWVVVYDASAGFVTGGGWIDVAPGSYPANPTLSGRANFGFNSKYKNGAQPPTGETEFNFSVANLNFHSDSYQWLVVSGFKAQYKGTGSLNGVSGYDFRLTGYDGDINGGGGIDKFRIKITRNGQTVFDNRMGVPEDPDVADPQAIAGGSIVIHRS